MYPEKQGWREGGEEKEEDGQGTGRDPRGGGGGGNGVSVPHFPLPHPCINCERYSPVPRHDTRMCKCRPVHPCWPACVDLPNSHVSLPPPPPTTGPMDSALQYRPACHPPLPPPAAWPQPQCHGRGHTTASQRPRCSLWPPLQAAPPCPPPPPRILGTHEGRGTRCSRGTGHGGTAGACSGAGKAAKGVVQAWGRVVRGSERMATRRVQAWRQPPGRPPPEAVLCRAKIGWGLRRKGQAAWRRP